LVTEERLIRLRSLVIVVGGCFTFAWLVITMSQEATSAPSSTNRGGTQQPVSCSVPPRDSASVIAVLATPEVSSHYANPEEPVAAMQPAGSPRPIATTPEPGAPADDATLSHARQTIELFVACQNAGNVGSMMALVSDDFVRQAFAMNSDERSATVYLSATPRPRPAGAQITILDVTDAQQLPDGQITVVVEVIDPARRGNARPMFDRYRLTPDAAGRLLIDNVVASIRPHVQSSDDASTPVH